MAYTSQNEIIRKPWNLDRVSEKYDISKRERTILELVLKGKNNKEIAEQLYSSGEAWAFSSSRCTACGTGS